LGAQFVDFSSVSDLVGAVRAITCSTDDGGDSSNRTDGGCHAVIVTSGHPAAFTHAADLLRVGGTLCCVGIPPGEVKLSTPIASIVIRGLKIVGNLVGSLEETLEAVEYVRAGKVRVHVEVRPFEELVEVFARLEKGDVPGRIVLEVGGGE
jgi:alcohol dehydrogenase, propanol-preferring